LARAPSPDLIAPTLSLRTGVSEGINESRGIGAPTVLAEATPPLARLSPTDLRLLLPGYAW